MKSISQAPNAAHARTNARAEIEADLARVGSLAHAAIDLAETALQSRGQRPTRNGAPSLSPHLAAIADAMKMAAALPSLAQAGQEEGLDARAAIWLAEIMTGGIRLSRRPHEL